MLGRVVSTNQCKICVNGLDILSWLSCRQMFLTSFKLLHRVGNTKKLAFLVLCKAQTLHSINHTQKRRYRIHTNRLTLFSTFRFKVDNFQDVPSFQKPFFKVILAKTNLLHLGTEKEHQICVFECLLSVWGQNY